MQTLLFFFFFWGGGNFGLSNDEHLKDGISVHKDNWNWAMLESSSRSTLAKTSVVMIIS